jgi:tRNA (guanine-N7-)-methyltransferase
MARERKGRELLTGIDRIDFHTREAPSVVSAFCRGGRPLEVDVGCGKGRFLLARARKCAGVNFLGVDRMLKRLAKLNRRAADAGLSNLRLVHGDGLRLMADLLPAACARAVYILFPDPWPKRRQRGRRLVAAPFNDGLHRALAPGGAVHFATDDGDYFRAIERLLGADARFRAALPFEPESDEQTDFEIIHRKRSAPIYRCSYCKV